MEGLHVDLDFTASISYGDFKLSDTVWICMTHMIGMIKVHSMPAIAAKNTKNTSSLQVRQAMESSLDVEPRLRDCD